MFIRLLSFKNLIKKPLKFRFVLMTSLLIFTSVTMYGQTFVCNGIKFYQTDRSPQSQQEFKKDYLGTKWTLTFYDNCVKVKSTREDGETYTDIFDKIDKDVYKLSDNRNTAVLKLSKWIEYIKSFTIEKYTNGRTEFVLTFKRD